MIKQNAGIFRRLFNALRQIGRRPVLVDASARRRQLVVDDPDCFVSVPYAKFRPESKTTSVIFFEEGADFHGEFLVNTCSLAVDGRDDDIVNIPFIKPT